MEKLLITILTSGVIASTITSVVNLLSIKKTNNRLVSIEKLKNDNSIQTFRYTKLFDLNVELHSLQEIDYGFLKKYNGKLVKDKDMLAVVVEKNTERFSSLKNIYSKSRPLFDKGIIVRVEDLIISEKKESDKIISKLYSNRESTDLSKLIDIRMELESELRNSIIHQLELLMN